MQVKPTGVRVLVMAALAGFVVPAEALADCPELEQLQSAYFEAWRPADGPFAHADGKHLLPWDVQQATGMLGTLWGLRLMKPTYGCMTICAD